jgi:hypothetical protein
MSLTPDVASMVVIHQPVPVRVGRRLDRLPLPADVKAEISGILGSWGLK